MSHVVLPNLAAFAFETITVSTTAIGPTAGTRAPSSGAAKAAIICNPGTSNDVRFTIDGTTPTASIGMRLAPDSIVVIQGEANVANLKMIREDAADVAVPVTYLR